MTYLQKVKIGFKYQFSGFWKFWFNKTKGFYVGALEMVGAFIVGALYILIIPIAPIWMFVLLLIEPILWPLFARDKNLPDDKWDILQRLAEKNNKS